MSPSSVHITKHLLAAWPVGCLGASSCNSPLHMLCLAACPVGCLHRFMQRVLRCSAAWLSRSGCTHRWAVHAIPALCPDQVWCPWYPQMPADCFLRMELLLPSACELALPRRQ